ncbi:hypothetical protein M430DRAFT_259960 [Amorphotheca resinae ATCC 22711]|uniref:Uncharacterized protein n=1 Tax=Amorphotheca resinae ATCC 22711 TaxID=857342 RepID=A0A2T3AZA4_AMORE|nr:hypothetical protein M430DRAFT_259960 [Amorphotheca resinae ATCC 22711]PSS15342.1 hypothetical protein M430DRAFT_259960 [Amorphotheca resinae ATCC 22711]
MASPQPYSKTNHKDIKTPLPILREHSGKRVGGVLQGPRLRGHPRCSCREVCQKLVSFPASWGLMVGRAPYRLARARLCMSRASIVVLFSRFWSGVPSRTMARPGSRSPLCPLLLSTRCWAGQSRGSPFQGSGRDSCAEFKVSTVFQPGPLQVQENH